jgi:hypothetical protein
MQQPDDAPQTQSTDKQAAHLITPKVAEIAKVFGYLTAILTAIALIASNSITVKKYFWPKREIVVLKFNDRNNITLVNNGDSSIFVDTIEYEYGTTGDSVTGYLAVLQQVDPLKAMIHKFYEVPENYGGVLTKADFPAQTLISRVIHGPTIDGGCLIRVMTTKFDSSYQRFSQTLADQLFEVPLRLRINAYDIGTGRLLSGSEIKGLEHEDGRVFFVQDSKPCSVKD